MLKGYVIHKYLHTIWLTTVSNIHVSITISEIKNVKVKVSRNRPEQAQRVPGRLRPRIFLTFGTKRVVG